MERRDLYDENRQLLNKTIEKGEKIPTGCFILVVMAFIENQEGKYLVQKRSELKGGEWSFTGGHPKHGESSLDGVKTEVLEELGIIPENPVLFKSIRGEDAFCDMYAIKQDIDLSSIVKQDEEVSGVMFCTKEEIDKLFEEGKFKKGHYMMFQEYLKYKKENNI